MVAVLTFHEENSFKMEKSRADPNQNPTFLVLGWYRTEQRVIATSALRGRLAFVAPESSPPGSSSYLTLITTVGKLLSSHFTEEETETLGKVTWLTIDILQK